MSNKCSMHVIYIHPHNQLSPPIIQSHVTMHLRASSGKNEEKYSEKKKSFESSQYNFFLNADIKRFVISSLTTYKIEKKNVSEEELLQIQERIYWF